MNSKDCKPLRVSFLPYFTPSHTIPLVDIARLFATRGVDVSIITTPANALLFQSSVDRDNATSGNKITVHTLKFPSAEVDLPEGIENFHAAAEPWMTSKLYRGIAMLQKPTEALIRGISAHCIVSDMFFPWTVELANELHIPRLFFNPSNFFFHCVSHSMKLYAPHDKVQSDSESFVIPGLPHNIEISRSQLPDHVKSNTRYGELINTIMESEIKSYGTIVNSFYELEHPYVEHLRNVIGRKCWSLGPVSHFSNRLLSKSSSTTSSWVMSWLNATTRKPNSVLYICFGSMVRFSDSQLSEIGSALEASGHPFIWVVRKREDEEEEHKWLSQGCFENGIIVREWAPQIQILEHPAVGGFVTHCGWNSVLEGVAAGVPFVSWPLFAEQFYNEKLITQVLKIGVGVGSEVWNSGFRITGPVVGRDKIERGVRRLMDVSEESEQTRERAKQLGLMAKKAVEDGGSSYSDISALIQEIKACAFYQKMS
ncbi:solanidine UDP-glucose glucosyltransferase 1-like [Cornus florida]|uniref:solanidine UDP-glucose glucosyltransferase 1-like n=1 Tax=Cornus florida TaxID=4283 RepID=UPI00289644C1|nr:solanidine UDP-glucose glucosyltransferase 1-like [Cornus florida]